MQEYINTLYGDGIHDELQFTNIRAGGQSELVNEGEISEIIK